ncbi:MAG: response regulator transcription factor [Campylobacterota bacterium]
MQGFHNLKVLYAEDNASVAQNTAKTLQLLQMQVDCVADGEDALQSYSKHLHDLIITDLKMPHLDGLQIIKEIRKHSITVPIVVLTSHSSSEYLLECANLNIQAYLLKPISLGQLQTALQKVQTYLAFTKLFDDTDLGEGLYFSAHNATVKAANGTVYRLNKKEKSLLELLLVHRDRVVSYEEIEQTVWHEHWEVMTSYALRSVIKNLRKKVGKERIVNISSLGYRFSS